MNGSDTGDPDTSNADKCCPLSEPPTSCNDVAMGGSRAKNPTCGHWHDNIGPVRRFVDEDGCPAYDRASDNYVPFRDDCPRRDASPDGATTSD